MNTEYDAMGSAPCAAVRTLAPTAAGVDGTRLPISGKTRTVFDATLVGSPAWSPPVQ